MILLTVEEIIRLHSRLIEKTGGKDGVRDKGLLESAVYSSENSFDGNEIYPTVQEKAARLCYSLINNHSFVDGNKRIGVFVMLMTLKLNSVSIVYTQKELIDLGLFVADGTWNYDDILAWIKTHLITT